MNHKNIIKKSIEFEYGTVSLFNNGIVAYYPKEDIYSFTIPHLQKLFHHISILSNGKLAPLYSDN